MFAHSLILVASTLSALALAVPTGSQANVVCGNNIYTPAEVTAAVNDGFRRSRDGRIIEGSYPGAFLNTERLSMSCGGNSRLEFPILPGGKAYTGGFPSADRVIFNESGVLCAVITHTGAPSVNRFVACKGARWPPGGLDLLNTC